MLDPAFLQILCCPRCRTMLTEHGDPHRLHCAACRLSYAVHDGIPNLLVEDAVPDVEAAGQAK